MKERQISKNFYSLFAESGIKFSEIGRISFINGPGSFTSLRFFLTFAKALKVSFSEVEVIPLNLLEVMGFQKGETVDVVMGGNREFLKFFHHARYENKDGIFKVVKDVDLISYEDAKKLKKPLFLGVKPEFEVTPYKISLSDMIKYTDYKIKNSDFDDIITLTPYYYKKFSTKK